MGKHDIVLKEKPLDEGLTKDEVADLFDKLNDVQGIPIEVQGENSVAMGFITPARAELMNYDFAAVNGFVKEILDDVEKENPWREYEATTASGVFALWLSR